MERIMILPTIRGRIVGCPLPTASEKKRKMGYYSMVSKRQAGKFMAKRWIHHMNH